MSALRKVAVCYSMIVAIAAAWAFVVDVQMLHSGREHLLPDITLALVTLPASRSTGWLFATWPDLFSQPLVQPGWMTLCGAVQALALFLVSRHADKVERKSASPD